MGFFKIFLPRIFCVGLFLLGSFGTNAQALDGFVSPAFVFIKQLNTPANAVTSESNPSASTDETSGRSRFEIQFGRLQRNVEFDLGFGNGGGYSDVGGVLRIFNHFYFGEKSSTGVSVGLGGGVRYSSGGIFALVSSGPDSLRSFYELSVSPFVRFIWDPMWGSFGLAFETGVEAIPRRSFSDDLSPDSDTQARLRYYAGLTVMISSRWLE